MYVIPQTVAHHAVRVPAWYVLRMQKGMSPVDVWRRGQNGKEDHFGKFSNLVPRRHVMVSEETVIL